MRIISGTYKRKPLLSLEGDTTRPTKDMVKEALFDTIIIYNDTSFLDLFAGSGAIGIEALSRGAKEVVFNDNNKDAVNIINKNLESINETCTVYSKDAYDLITRIKGPFDYIFMDPPYNYENYDVLIDKIYELKLLKKGGIIIAETSSDKVLEHMPYKEKKYGKTKLLYFKNID